MILPLLLAAAATPAWAAPFAASYQAEVDGNTVIVCPHWHNDRACPQQQGMLREDVTSGDVVRLPQTCTNRTGRAGSGACYVDECVAPGRYRYGYARPLECTSTSTQYFTQVVVVRPLPGDCKRSGAGTLASVPGAPWGPSPYVCVAGCGTELARLPQLSWGLILLLAAGASFLLLYHRYGRRAA